MQNKKRALYILFKASLNRQTQFSFVYENEQKQSFFLCALNIYFYVPVLQLRQLTPISQKSFNLLEQTPYENCFVRCLSCTITKALCTKAQY